MSVDSWTLQVKSLEQVTQSVTISSSASVLQLKDAIQPVFDVASNRQRLIFQGKVLKDGKQLTEYANLQDGKVIHLVSRPPDAPSNALNDDPQTNTSRESSSQMIPGLFGPSGGYTFITVDANISDLGGSQSQSLVSLLNGLFGNGSDRNHSTNTRTYFSAGHGRSSSGSSPNTQAATGNMGARTRTLPPRDIGRNRRQPSDFPSLFDASLPYTSPVSALEIRLIRALTAIANIQATLQAPPATTGASQISWTSMSNATPEQSQAIRSQLRANRSSGLAQTGLAVDRLADLMENLTPRLRQLAHDLQAEDRSHSEMMPELRRMITVIRSLSMVNHAIGNIMASSDDSSRRPGGLRSSPLGRTGRDTTSTASTTNASRAPATTNMPQNQQPSTANEPGDTNSNPPAITTSTSASNKRKLESSTLPSSPALSSSSSSPSLTCTAAKRQKTNNDNTDIDRDQVDYPTSSLTSTKGKGHSQPETKDN